VGEVVIEEGDGDGEGDGVEEEDDAEGDEEESWDDVATTMVLSVDEMLEEATEILLLLLLLSADDVPTNSEFEATELRLEPALELWGIEDRADTVDEIDSEAVVDEASTAELDALLDSANVELELVTVEEEDIAVGDAVEDAVDVDMLAERTDVTTLDLEISVDVRIVVETLEEGAPPREDDDALLDGLIVLHLPKPSWHVFASQ
jgi:hypothetical protein